MGFSLADLGDVDGDGVRDHAVGAPGESVHGHWTGGAWIFSGADGAPLQHGSGADAYDQFGNCVAAAGDLDGDGRSDVAIGEPALFSSPGAVHVHSSATGASLLTIGEIQGNSTDFGSAIAGLGDVNGDGIPDLAIGAESALDARGEVTVHSGADGTLLYSRHGTTSRYFGNSLAALPDLDGDGVSELLVGARGSPTFLGAAFVLSGATGDRILRFDGSYAEDRFGASVALLGDVDGDGVADLAVDAPGGSLWYQTGAVSLFSGADGALLRVIAEPPGVHASFGASVAGPGDVDGDGHADVLIGAPTYDVVVDSGGRVYPYSGSDGALLLELGPESDEPEWFGHVVAPAGGVDGDGRPDLMVGAPNGGASSSLKGAARVFGWLPPGPGTDVCAGDGSGTDCPCDNVGEAQRGCANAAGRGARLYTQGSASVSSDDLELLALHLRPNQPALAFAGDFTLTGGAGIRFGDGLRCADGDVVRLDLRASDEFGVVRFGPGLGAAGGWSVGEMRTLQVWYRDPQGPCGSGFNTTQARELVFAP